jgi:hypothetical protein
MMLTLKGSVARVAIKDEDDAAEFRLVHDHWISEDCEIVAFDFPLSIFRSMEAPAVTPLPELPENPTQYVKRGKSALRHTPGLVKGH